MAATMLGQGYKVAKGLHISGVFWDKNITGCPHSAVLPLSSQLRQLLAAGSLRGSRLPPATPLQRPLRRKLNVLTHCKGKTLKGIMPLIKIFNTEHVLKSEFRGEAIH